MSYLNIFWLFSTLLFYKIDVSRAQYCDEKVFSTITSKLKPSKLEGKGQPG